jgi:undecaprenyl-diphosphatase
VPIAWARLYLGVHFPLDMVGAAMVAVMSAWLAFREVHVYLPNAYRLALSVLRFLFRKLIQVGWVQK